MNRPSPPTVEEVKHAEQVLRSVCAPTPLVPWHSFADASGLMLKLEVHQPVTSFKVRGIYYAVAQMDETQRQRGLSTVSAGNTAQALAWVGSRFGVSVRSIMPDTAPQEKIEAVKSYGGTPVLVPREEGFRFVGGRLWEREPYAFVHPWIDRNVMIGHGTLGLEILRECPQLDTLFVPVGGGGLMAGVGTVVKALQPNVQVVAVEPSACAALHASLAAGRPLAVDCETICDGVAVPYMTEEVFHILSSVVDRVDLVSDDEVTSTVKRLLLRNKVLAEPSGALACTAAFRVPASNRGRAVCVVTGGSVDASKVVSIIES